MQFTIANGREEVDDNIIINLPSIIEGVPRDRFDTKLPKAFKLEQDKSGQETIISTSGAGKSKKRDFSDD